jgi:hypothetical protein
MTVRMRLAVAGVLLAAALAGGCQRGQRYEGLAESYPPETMVFAEIRELGQWLPSPTGPASAGDDSFRGQDPMLQVLGQVWANEPVKPTDLPSALAHQPLVFGLWKEGARVEGAALLALGSGQEALLRSFFDEHLHLGEKAGEAGGVTLYRVVLPEGEEEMEAHLREACAGVSPRWGVFATSPAAARRVLQPSGPGLSGGEDFQRAWKRLQPEKGAFLFISRKAFAEAAAPLKKEMGLPAVRVAPAETPAEGGVQPSKPREFDFQGEILEPLSKFVAADTLGPLALWTAPPAGPTASDWTVRSFLGYGPPARGLWRLAAEGGPRRPSLDGRLPRDGRLYLWGGGKDPARLYGDSLEELQKVLTPDRMGWIRAGLGAAEGKMGLSFSSELLPALGDEWCLVLGPEAKDRRWALYFTTRDPRRLEDLLANKIAPQLRLEKQTFEGAVLWKPAAGSLLAGEALAAGLSGGILFLSGDPAWALGTSQPPSAAFKEFAAFGGKASLFASVNPALWSEKATSPAVLEGTFGGDGFLGRARFPGGPLRIPRDEGGRKTAAPEK